MDPATVAIVTLLALAVGMLIPVLVQLWLTLRQLRRELQDMRSMVTPVLDDVRGLTKQFRANAQIGTAIAVAVSAGVQAWVKARHEASSDAAQQSPETEESP